MTSKGLPILLITIIVLLIIGGGVYIYSLQEKLVNLQKANGTQNSEERDLIATTASGWHKYNYSDGSFSLSFPMTFSYPLGQMVNLGQETGEINLGLPETKLTSALYGKSISINYQSWQDGHCPEDNGGFPSMGTVNVNGVTFKYHVSDFVSTSTNMEQYTKTFWTYINNKCAEIRYGLSGAYFDPTEGIAAVGNIDPKEEIKIMDQIVQTLEFN